MGAAALAIPPLLDILAVWPLTIRKTNEPLIAHACRRPTVEETPMRMLRYAVAAVLCAAACTTPAIADENFYAGKRLTVLINFAPGGPTDIEGRLFARHVARHLGGKPTVIVQNMAGAGGGVGTNYLGEVAPRDGTMVGYLTGAAWRYVNVHELSRADFLTYRPVAYQPGTTVYYFRSDTVSSYKEPADFLKARNIVIGGLSAESSKDMLLRLTLDMLGVNYKYVTGYKSNSDARLAFQRGEISMFSESPPGYRAVVEPGMIAKGEAFPLFYDPGWNGARFSEPAQVKGLTLPPFQEFFRKAKGVEPSGKLWQMYLHILAVNGAMQRMVVYPPGTPDGAMAAMRAAIRKLETDPLYAEEAMKLVGFVPDYEASESVEADVRKALSIPAEDKEWLQNYIKNAPK
jgi:tripartite-type tricarboxylate transporter receptor subunit TctC